MAYEFGQQMYRGQQPAQPPQMQYQPAQQPQHQPMMQMQHGFSVQPVASREEALAVQTDFFGPGVLLPCLGQGAIYLKRFNQNTGASDLIEFVYAPPQPPPAPVEYAPLAALQQLAQRVEQIERGGGARNDATE